MAFNPNFLEQEEEESIPKFDPMSFDVEAFEAYNLGDHSYNHMRVDPVPGIYDEAALNQLFPVPSEIGESSTSAAQGREKRPAPDEELEGTSSRKKARIDPAASNEDGVEFPLASGSEQRARETNPLLILSRQVPGYQPPETMPTGDDHVDNDGGNDQQPSDAQSQPGARSRQRAATPSSSQAETKEERTKRLRKERERVKREKRCEREEAGMRPNNVCGFCENDPIGIQAHAQQPCNLIWNEDMTVECQNCADHRSRNPGMEVKCKVQNQEMELVRYGVNDPVAPAVSACDRCTRLGIENTCDVDAHVGMACRNCKTMCLVGGSAQKARLDEKLPGRPWYRHACERCTVGPSRVQNSQKCSWLSDRSAWDRGCNRCLHDGAGCLKSGHLVHKPDEARFVAPSTWAIPSMREMEAETTELRLNSTPWRRMCTACQEFRSQNTCLVPFNQLWAACIRCTQLGINCITVVKGGDMDPSNQQQDDEETNEQVLQPKKRGRPKKKQPKKLDPIERVLPIANLGRVGFGKYLPYEICKRCLEMRRPCDRQRPCDSCVDNNEEDLCDKFERKRGKERKLHNCMKRSNTPLGPLYYLALGYGPGGVNTVKDGSRPLDWVGPMVPKYGAQDVKGYGTTTKPFADAVATEAGRLRPEGAPPHGGPGGSLRDVRPSALTVEMLDTMLVNHGVHGGPNTAWRYRQIVQIMISPHWPNGWIGVQLPPPGPAVRPGAKRAKPWTQETQNQALRAPQASLLDHQPQAPESHFDNMVRAAAVAHQLSHSGQGAPSNAFSDHLNQTAMERGMIQDDPSRAATRYASTQGTQPTLPTSQSSGANRTQDASLQQPTQFVQPPQTVRSNPASPIQSDLESSKSIQRSIENAVSSQTQVQHEQAQAQPPVQPQTPTSDQQAGDQAPGDYNNQGQSGSGYSLLDHLNDDGTGFNRGLLDQFQAASQQDLLNAPLLDDRMSHNALDGLLEAEQAARVTFNPFLGTSADLLPPDRRARQSVSQRWQPYNYLEGIAMEHWQEQQLRGPQDLTHPGIYRLFGLAGNKFIADNPARDVLAETELRPDVDDLPGLCMEPVQAGGIGVCGQPVTDQVGCRSLTHRDNSPEHFLVCQQCQDASARVLVDREGSAISRREMLSMRAYTCDECAETVVNSDSAAATLPNDGTRRIWGTLRGRTVPGVISALTGDLVRRSIKYEARTMPATGCSCATKLLEQPLCRYHRLFYADLAMRQVALMKEFRLLRFHKQACPVCLNFKGTRNANLSADSEGFRDTAGRPTAWVCLACNDWVVNQRNDANNKPQLVPGQLASLDVNQWFPGTDAS